MFLVTKMVATLFLVVLVQQRGTLLVKVWDVMTFWGERWARSRRSRIVSVRGSSFFFSLLWDGIEMNIGGRYPEDSTSGGERSPRRDWRSWRPNSRFLGAILSFLS